MWELASPQILAHYAARLARTLDAGQSDELRGPCPCESCRLCERCAVRLEACEAFSLFVNGLPEPRWRLTPRVPTREHYETIYKGSPIRAQPRGGGRPRGVQSP